MARRNRLGEDDDGMPLTKTYAVPLPCQDCTTSDAQVRASHHLAVAHEGMEALKAHLHRHYAQHVSPEMRAEAHQALIAWVGNLMSLYAGLADDHTGAPLTWWEARTRVASQLRATCALQQANAPTRQPRPPTPIEGFAQVQSPYTSPVATRHDPQAFTEDAPDD